jgi:hypothetical protein
MVDGVPGFLTPREVEFLAFLGASPTTTRGCIVELGTLHGKSAVALAAGARLADQCPVHTVDLKARDDVAGHLERCRVHRDIQTYLCPSHEFWRTFREPIRLFWHDGANETQYVAQDVRCATKLLVDRAIVAFHDVLNSSGERLHVFVDNVLAQPVFGAAGVVGSIGWAQYRAAGATADELRAKQRLIRGLSRLKPFHTLPSRRTKGLRRVVYETYRQMVPHGAVNAQSFLKRVA